MAWVTPRTWVPTELVTATMLNQHIRDNLNALRADQVLAIIPRTDTGAVNNWAPTLSSAQTFIEWNGAADVAITGLAGGAAGMQVTVKNITTSKIATFAFNSGSSLTANRFQNLATSAPTPIAPGGWVRYVYDGTDWKLIDHEQGAWITAIFAAGDFTGNGSMTWTLASIDRVRLAYQLEGRKLTVTANIVTSTVGGTLNTQLLIGNGQWGGFTAITGSRGSYWYQDNGTSDSGFVNTATTTQIGCFLKALGSWAASTDNTSVQFTFQFEIN